ncbi:hypothetical protein H8B02_30585 [Bradyrhizobium sp. Pear77]|uniref:hypothetical protein n=1 Tax=Bradyrhizobium altum TaxID=1571202 RepID=UPI001E642169|nr:hypothetical protein [Bradyrhizobium altum]MCC8957622.1 hypothetical protein [Bradyrhizobium altum]
MTRTYCTALGLLLGLGVATQAHAGFVATSMSSERANLTQVQWRCTPSSCINEQNGLYTQSHCGYRGCRPIPGVVGRLGPNGYDSKYDDPYSAYGQYRGGYRHRYYRY